MDWQSEQQWAFILFFLQRISFQWFRSWNLTGERWALSCGISFELRNTFFLAVIRLEGMRLMRPERSWRPIVTVEIDEHNTHETILGVDGQNINQKEAFNLCVLINSFFHAYLWPNFLSLFSSSVTKQRFLLFSELTFGSAHKVKRNPKRET